MAYDFFEKLGRKGEVENTGNAQYTRRFMAVFDAAVNDEAIVATLPEVPLMYSPHPVDPFSLVTKISPEQHDEDFSVWDILVSYNRISIDPRQADVNPLARYPKIRWETHKQQKPLIFDINGNAVVNSAGDLFVPAFQMDDSRKVATITVNLSDVPVWLLDIDDAVNSSPLTIEGQFIDFKCGKIQGVTVSEWQYENNSYFRTVTIVIEIRPPIILPKVSYGGTYNSAVTATNYKIGGWVVAIQDAGFREINSSGELVNIVLDDGTHLKEPALLGGSGAKLSTPIATGSEYYRVFDAYKTFDFTALNLPA